MRLKRNILKVWVMVTVLFFSLSLSVYAHDVPDMNRRGSITITMTHNNEAVSGGTLTIYRAGKVVEDDGNYDFAPVDDFVDSGETFDDLSALNELAERLAQYAKAESIAAAETKTIGADGKVTFEDLELGLYLVVQNEPSKGYSAIAPFILSIPYMEDGVYEYDLSAQPKTDLEPVKTTPTPTPTPTDTPNIPQTGMLWWPVPVLTFGGLLFLLIGVLLMRGCKRDEK